MSRKPQAGLPAETIRYLATGGHTVVVATVDAEGRADVDLISWVKAVNDHTIRFVVGGHYPAVQNIQRNGQVTLQMLGRDQVYAVKGTASVLKDKMNAMKSPQMLFEMVVDEVRANMYGAGMIDGDVPVRRDDRVEAVRQKVEAAVYAEIDSP